MIDGDKRELQSAHRARAAPDLRPLPAACDCEGVVRPAAKLRRKRSLDGSLRWNFALWKGSEVHLRHAAGAVVRGVDGELSEQLRGRECRGQGSEVDGEVDDNRR